VSCLIFEISTAVLLYCMPKVCPCLWHHSQELHLLLEQPRFGIRSVLTPSISGQILTRRQRV
jgi:hypothetical protein